tara:strand:- start:95 stop:514 length:420 start_codon:yes stop_codon:yes gene_type:complete
MSRHLSSVGKLHETNEVKLMFKSALAAVAALPILGSAAIAGPYVNVEANSGWTGSDYNSTTTEAHVGYAGDLSETASYYVQAGPAFISEDGEATETELSGKVGATVALADNVDFYGEVSFVTSDDDNGYGTKFGVTYSF